MMARPLAPDVVVLVPDWQTRALVRAQLIEDGLEVIATDTWPTMRQHLRPGAKPRLAFVDLKGLADPDRVLEDLRVLMKPDRVLVLTAIGTMAPADVEGLRFHALSRPIPIDRLVRSIASLAKEVEASA